MTITNQTRPIEWHETCKCKCRLDSSVCNNRQCQNHDKCRCECKELIDKGVCNKESIWNPSNCECEYDKSFGEYLDYKNCKKTLLDKLTEECIENIDKVKTASENNRKNKYNSCTLYILLFSIIFAINIGIGAYFIYYKWMNRDKETASRYDYIYKTKI